MKDEPRIATCAKGGRMTATRFFSDNAATVHPAVMESLAAANQVDTAYDGDALSRSLDARFSDLFETDCEVLWVSTGTAANRSEEHTSNTVTNAHLVCRLLLAKKKKLYNET